MTRSPTPTKRLKGQSPPRALAETELYPALRDFFVARGFTVRAEVRHADLVAKMGDELVIVEMKTRMTMGLLAQGLKRRAATSHVYVAIPRPEKVRRGSPFAEFKAVVKGLGLGLLVVSFEGSLTQVQEVLAPKGKTVKGKPTRSRSLLAREFEGRSGDFNVGGSTKVPLLTAYREKTIRVAACFIKYGALAPKALREKGAPANVQGMVARDYYGWFEKKGPALYALSSKGEVEIRSRYPELLQHYLQELA